MNRTTVQEPLRPPICERCGTEMVQFLDGDIPVVWECPQCGHQCCEENDEPRDRGEDDS